MIWLAGTARPSTAITATPRPIAVLTFLDTAKKVHIPRKNDKAIFSMKIVLINKLK
jgi:hypothetical protein